MSGIEGIYILCYVLSRSRIPLCRGALPRYSIHSSSHHLYTPSELLPSLEFFTCIFHLSSTMPIKWVLHWQPNAGSTVNTQILTELSQCVESINGSKGGRWKSVLTFYRPMLRDPKAPAEIARDFMGLSLQEQPDKYYFTIRGQRIVLEADSAIQMIMEKLQSYKSRVQLYFEGIQYQLGDFQLKVGKVVPIHSENLRGIVMEVEYLPLSSIEKSRQIMEEFVDIWQETVSKKSLPGHFMHVEPNFGEYGLTDHYTSQHTAVQYATVMAQLIATVRN
ncbi:mediator of RNA polymerase II transcription subunit 20a-like [Aristolochia californica]|uniref:mediator of RNA polymerase II transcription subunit 20a-like n=1 Tax=Aristolochia californica TaxID=171875 RepID=UPI0035DF0FCE